MFHSIFTRCKTITNFTVGVGGVHLHAACYKEEELRALKMKQRLYNTHNHKYSKIPHSF